MRKFSVGFACAMIAAASASAVSAQSIYSGDCARARLLAQQRTVNLLLPADGYYGVMRARYSATSCTSENVEFVDLVQSSRSTTSIVYTSRYITLDRSVSNGVCSGSSLRNATSYGDVTFTTSVLEANGVCDLVLLAAFRDRNTEHPEWRRDWSTRATLVANGSFVVHRTVATTGGFSTPVAFTPSPD